MDPQQENFDQSVKILLIGDVCVGKTQLIYRYCENKFLNTYLSTIGVNYNEKSIDIEGKKILMKIWDSSGQERFKQYTLSGYKGASAIILVYSINDRGSFNNVITFWTNQIKQYASENVCILLIGNKIDESNRQVARDEGDAFARQFGFLFYETSAKEGTNVTDAFYAIVKQITEKQPIPSAEKQHNPPAEKKQCNIF
ncbi:unnamed protein product [Paramecium pentaurelia]|uniref:Uncharacterized protein n=1 Tax=Paramecium pentaurelia TaxID=43138 RepID=A0A8S1USA7_9CILI|nr:unnamed protein product [Paramecium pentaurelia]